MIEYISGNIAELTPTLAVIEANGVGYGINITLGTYSAINGKQSAKLFIYEAIREDAYVLYGFATKEERQMFLLLISVSGVGAGTARMILSSVSTAELRDAVLSGNELILKGVKGIGLKTAQRIIVDLRDKVASVDTSAVATGVSQAAQVSGVSEEASQALVMLGFPNTNVRKVVQKIVSETPSLSVEQIIKQALKMM
ncbi:MAG: Holliday junction branch migration protein RuvA [Paludibacteraceae bacterium]|nr:Holliday junction branch migration protein RuvA [Paludibacteraceae bacterium]